MKNYEKPVIIETRIQVEGVYAGSGSEGSDEDSGDKVRCSHGQKNFKPHTGVCQKCNQMKPGNVIAPECPEGLPMK